MWAFVADHFSGQFRLVENDVIVTAASDDVNILQKSREISPLRRQVSPRREDEFAEVKREAATALCVRRSQVLKTEARVVMTSPVSNEKRNNKKYSNLCGLSERHLHLGSTRHTSRLVFLTTLPRVARDVIGAGVSGCLSEACVDVKRFAL